MREKDILERCKDILKEINQAPALSCVEYYFIPWLKQYFPVKKLYAETILPYVSIEAALHQSSFANLDTIPRIQDLAEKYAITTHEKGPFSYECANKSDLVLLRVNRCYFEGAQVAWRDDHYIRLVAMTGKYFYIVNAYPMEIRKIPRNNIDWIQGEGLVFRFLGSKNVSVREICFESKENIPNVPTMSEFRDALIVYRTILKRLREVVGDGAGLQTLISKADILFYRSAIAVRKNNTDAKLVLAWREELIRSEEKFQ